MTFIETLEQLLGIQARKNFLPMQAGDVLATCADTEELRRDVGFVPATSLYDGLAAWTSWFRTYHGLR
jgi:UDP-glucuronate 4-epimerase